MQSLLDHTSQRLLLTFKKKELDKLHGKKLMLHLKYGMDGSSNPRVFQQKCKQPEKPREGLNVEESVAAHEENEDEQVDQVGAQEENEEDQEVEGDDDNEIEEDHRGLEDQDVEEEQEVEDRETNQNGQSQEGQSESDIDYASVFNVSCVPLELKCGRKIVWKNERPSSIRLCRPIEFRFMKESYENTQKTTCIMKKSLQI